MCTLVGAEGGIRSLDASVVRVTALLVDALASGSSALTVNVYVVAGVRCRRTTSVSPYQFRCWLTWVPFPKMRYVTNVEVSPSPGSTSAGPGRGLARARRGSGPEEPPCPAAT
jgi:hypothetical protein